MYTFNKLVWLFLSPVSIGVELFFCAFVLALFRSRLGKGAEWNRKWLMIAWGCAGVGALWLFFWSMPIASLLCVKLARLDDYSVPADSSIPSAEAIVSLGGGYCGERDCTAVRLWRLNKAQILIPTARGEAENSKNLMVDMGVPEERVIIDDKARNTEENAEYVSKLLKERLSLDSLNNRPKVLLVTSWYHMKRSMIIHQKVAPEIDWIPVITKYGALDYWPGMPFLEWINPSIGTLYKNSTYSKECLGILGYRVRGF